MGKFKISVIIPIYNVEDYLEETIESVVNQTIGFEKNVQLVLVNDGSPDNSKDICLKYKNLYPGNIVYYKQKNAGVSVARNKGLELVDGDIVTMLDSDDVWSKDAFKEVVKMANKYPDVNVFSCRMNFFDAKHGGHPLNYKYKEDKIIDIREDYEYIQLSTCSCFVRKEVIKNYKYDSEIKNEEDTRFINEILLDNYYMGILHNPTYYYRKRADQSSASQTSKLNKLWYTVTPKKVYEYLYEESIKRFGKVLDYFQFLIAYDIGWRLNIPGNEEVLNDNEIKDYIKTINNLIKQTDLKFFKEQKHIYPTQNLFLLKIKDDIKDDSLLREENHKIYIDGVSEEEYDNIVFIRVDDVFESKGKIYLFGRINTEIYDKNKVYLNINGKLLKPEFYETRTNYDEPSFDGGYLGRSLGIRCEIDIKDLEYFGFQYGKEGELLSLTFGNQCMITHLLNGSYFTFGNKMVTYDDGKFTLVDKKASLIFKREIRNIKGLLKRKKYKVCMLRYLICLSKLLPHKEIWLLSDRVNMADDNAEHLFKYLNENHKDTVQAYYVISKESKDFKRMKQYGKVVSNTSLKYKLLFHNASYIVSSHAEFYITNLYGKSNMYYRDLFKFKYAFLQHGITQADISPWLNPNTKHIDMFVSAVEMEYNALKINGYNDGVVQLTGFARYDGLIDNSKKYELKKSIMMSFTWRSKLVNQIDKKTGDRIYNPEFKNSNYFIWMNSLLNNKKLFEALDKYGYRIKFVPHPNLKSQIEDFVFDDKYIDMDTSSVNYQKEFCENSILVTDFSSVFFDFAYLNKPIIYYQPDKADFYEGQIYDKGYFDYDKMGFGPVFEDENKLVDYIIELMKNDCNLEKKYEKRIGDFFKYNDKNNCERVYKAIINTQDKN